MNITIDHEFNYTYKGLEYFALMTIECEVTKKFVNGGTGFYGDVEKCYDFNIYDVKVVVDDVYDREGINDFPELIEAFTPRAKEIYENGDLDLDIINEYINNQ